MSTAIRLLGVVALTVLTTPFAAAQAAIEPEGTRREYFTPGLVVETGARRGACDVLTFTADGSHLLACGDDKAVRCWELGPGKALHPAAIPALRWRTWHEARGNIYAIALSPDKQNRLVAVAGQGMSVGALAVLDRFDGTIRYAFPGDQKIKHGTVWSMAFSPTGKQVAYGAQDGSVWVWDLREGKLTFPRLLGRHNRGGGKKTAFDFIRLVKYLDAERVLSASEGGQVVLWRIPAGNQAAEKRVLFNFKAPQLYRFAASPDGKWVAGAGEDIKHVQVELCSLPDGAQRRQLHLPKGEMPHSLAFSADSSKLAVGIRLVDQPTPNDPNPFYKETTNKVQVYDLKSPVPKATPGPTPTYHPEAMAFHPDGRHLAIAGGNDHEVTLWDLATMKRVSEVRGPGSGLWSVAASPDARYLGFKTQRNLNPMHPNDRGAGPWKVFDLLERRWAQGIALKVPKNKDEEGGWKIRTGLTEAEGKAHGIPQEEWLHSYIWYVRDKAGKIYKLPLARYDHLPRSYAFIPATKKHPVRLIVGHLWSASVFDLTPSGPKRTRLLTGHEGEVMTLAVAQDGKRLVTASRDQTVSGWSLEDWPYHPELGANFLIRNGRLFAGDVAAGSPTWELGLDPKDEILLLAVTRQESTPKLVYSLVKEHGTVGTPAAALETIETAGAGEELYFYWKRARDGKVLQASMTVRQRPLWRFFPTRDGEWVLWRWRDFYYDTSTNGDYLIGWVRSHKELQQRPDFYKAEQFRKEFHRPELVAQMLSDWKAPEKEMKFLDFEPPTVTLRPSGDHVKDGDLTVTLTATPRGTGENHKIVRVLLWVNDYQFKEWITPQELALDPKGAFRQKEVKVPRSVLRAGPNLLVLQAYNHGAARGETSPVQVVHDRPPPSPTLHGIFVGVSDYRQARPPLDGLRAAEDARAMFQLWQRRSTPLYENVHLIAPLLDGNATRAKILQRLEELREKAKPDDRLVLHLGGHGARPQELEKALNIPKRMLQGLDNFLYCCSDFNKDRLAETTIGFEELYKVLVKLPCHKVVLLDTCHSGDIRSGVESTASNPIRILTRDGVGPVILAACQPDESAYEDDSIDLARAYGLFTIAIRRTLEEAFAKADANDNRSLEAREMVSRVKVEVSALVDQLRQERVLDEKARQTPIEFLPGLAADLPLLRRAAGK